MSREEIVESVRRLVGQLALGPIHRTQMVELLLPEIERLLADERERVREMCAGEADKEMASEVSFQKERDSSHACFAYCSRRIANAIRQLDLTKELAPSTEEGEK